MPYTTPPTFTNGALLSAAQLNILSDDVDFLDGIARAPNIPFPVADFNTTANKTWYVRYRHRYLLYQYEIAVAPADDVKFFVGGLEAYHDGSPAVGVVTGSIDLLSGFGGFSPVLRAWYPVRLEYIPAGGSTFRLRYLVHANATAL